MLTALVHRLAGRKFVFAESALILLSVLAGYALHLHESGSAIAAFSAIGGLGAIFQHAQGKADVAESASLLPAKLCPPDPPVQVRPIPGDAS